MSLIKLPISRSGLEKPVNPLLSFILSLLLSFTLASLTVDGYVDRVYYLDYAENSLLYLINYSASGPLSIIFNEPLWLLVNIGLSFLFEPENVIRLIVFFSAFVTCFLIINNTDKKYFFWLILFLLLPQVLKNNINHLRQGFGISVFLLGWFSSPGCRRYLLFLCAAFIHSSFIIVLIGFLSVRLVSSLRVSGGIRNVYYIVIGLGFGFFTLAAASYLGARQGEQYVERESVSGFGFVYWLFVLCLFLCQNKDFLRRNSAQIFFIILYLCTYFILPVTARVFESVLLTVLIAGLYIRREYKFLFYVSYLFYFTLMWASRLVRPGLGWAL